MPTKMYTARLDEELVNRALEREGVSGVTELFRRYLCNTGSDTESCNTCAVLHEKLERAIKLIKKLKDENAK